MLEKYLDKIEFESYEKVVKKILCTLEMKLLKHFMTIMPKEKI